MREEGWAGLGQNQVARVLTIGRSDFPLTQLARWRAGLSLATYVSVLAVPLFIGHWTIELHAQQGWDAPPAQYAPYSVGPYVVPGPWMRGPVPAAPAFGPVAPWAYERGPYLAEPFADPYSGVPALRPGGDQRPFAGPVTQQPLTPIPDNLNSGRGPLAAGPFAEPLGTTRLTMPEPGVQSPRTNSAGPFNCHVVVTEEFLNRLAAREQQEPGAVRDNILGAEVFGEQRTRSRLTLDLIPNSGAVQANFMLDGTTDVSTVGITPQAQVGTVGQQEFRALKEVRFDGRQLMTRAAQVNARATNVPIGATTPLSGRPLLGPIAEQLALRIAQQRRPEAEAIARDKTMTKVFNEFNQQVDQGLYEGNESIGVVFARLDKAGLTAKREIWDSTDRHAHGGFFWGRTDEPPTIRPLPSEQIEDHAINFYFHDSALNALATKLNLAGTTTTDKQLRSQVEQLKRMLPLVVTEGEAAAPTGLVGMADVETEIELDPTDPLKFEFVRDELLITIQAKFRPAGQDLLPAMKVQIPLKLQIRGDRLELSSSGARARSIDRWETVGDGTITEKLVEKSINDSMPPLFFSRELPPGTWKGTGPAPQVTGLRAYDGWLIVSLD